MCKITTKDSTSTTKMWNYYTDSNHKTMRDNHTKIITNRYKTSESCKLKGFEAFLDALCDPHGDDICVMIVCDKLCQLLCGVYHPHHNKSWITRCPKKLLNKKKSLQGGRPGVSE